MHPIKTSTLVFAVIFGFMPMTTDAQEIAPEDQIKIDTWEPTLGIIDNALDTASERVNWERFDNLVQDGVQTLDWGACKTYFAPKEGDYTCNSGGESDQFVDEVKDFILSPMFTKLMLYVDDGRIMNNLIGKFGSGRAEILLTQNRLLYSTQFDISYGLAFQNWMNQNCNIRLWDGFHDAPEGYLSREECLQHDFTTFVRQSYCPEDNSDACLSNSSWLYGFLGRRYLGYGIGEVENWQELFKRAAIIAGVEDSSSEN